MAENECKNAVDLGDTTAKSWELMSFRPTRQELITLGLYHLERHFDALELAHGKEPQWGYRESVFSWERFLQIRAVVGNEAIFEETLQKIGDWEKEDSEIIDEIIDDLPSIAGEKKPEDIMRWIVSKTTNQSVTNWRLNVSSAFDWVGLCFEANHAEHFWRFNDSLPSRVKRRLRTVVRNLHEIQEAI